MIVPCGIPVINDCPKLCSNKNHIHSFSAHKPKTQESRNNCSDGGGCTAQAKRISSGTIEAAGVDHDDMVPPNQQLHFAAFGVADVFQSDFWNWHTHRHIEAKLID